VWAASCPHGATLGSQRQTRKPIAGLASTQAMNLLRPGSFMPLVYAWHCVTISETYEGSGLATFNALRTSPSQRLSPEPRSPARPSAVHVEVVHGSTQISGSSGCVPIARRRQSMLFLATAGRHVAA
jgi:hypothetical protein